MIRCKQLQLNVWSCRDLEFDFNLNLTANSTLDPEGTPFVVHNAVFYKMPSGQQFAPFKFSDKTYILHIQVGHLPD